MRKLLKIKAGWEMKCRAVPYTNMRSVRDYPVDRYPEKDQYLPDACIAADAKMRSAGMEVDRNHLDWTVFFMESMDEILSEKGLRVL